MLTFHDLKHLKLTTSYVFLCNFKKELKMFFTIASVKNFYHGTLSCGPIDPCINQVLFLLFLN